MLPKLQSMKNKKTSEEVVGLSPFKKAWVLLFLRIVFKQVSYAISKTIRSCYLICYGILVNTSTSVIPGFINFVFRVVLVSSKISPLSVGWLG